MKAHLRVPEDRSGLRPALAAELEPGDVDAGLVFVATADLNEWDQVAAEMGEAFDLTQAAARAGAPVVYVVASEDLLGRRGAPAAMVACGLLSGARSLAFETRSEGIPVNVVAPEADTPPAVVSRWVVAMLRSDGPTGELIRLGGSHIGKALP